MQQLLFSVIALLLLCMNLVVLYVLLNVPQEIGPETLEVYLIANIAVQFLCEDHTSFYFHRHKYVALVITWFSVAVLLYRSCEALSVCSCSTSSSAAGHPSI